MSLQWVYDDGGRSAAGYRGKAGDCVVRAITIASELPYDDVYKALAEINAKSRSHAKCAGRRSARNGVDVKCLSFKRYMEGFGWKWKPAMAIGQGCKVHLVAEDLPKGRLIVSLSKHYTCVIDHVIHDAYDPRRGPTDYYTDGVVTRTAPDRCVYGYWWKEADDDR